jgi:hypothetical protein
MTDELLLEQQTVFDELADSPVKEGGKHSQSLSCLPFHLVDVRGAGKLNIEGHLKVPCCFDPLYWLSDKLHLSGFLDATRGLNKENIGAV